MVAWKRRSLRQWRGVTCAIRGYHVTLSHPCSTKSLPFNHTFCRVKRLKTNFRDSVRLGGWIHFHVCIFRCVARLTMCDDSVSIGSFSSIEWTDEEDTTADDPQVILPAPERGIYICKISLNILIAPQGMNVRVWLHIEAAPVVLICCNVSCFSWD